MVLDLKDFNKVKEKAEEFYSSVTEVLCPYLKEKISFNAMGMEHLNFKDRRKARTQQDQFMRLKLLHLAPKVLKLSSTLQGICEIKSFERIKKHSRIDNIMVNITYCEFIAVIDEYRVKVIIKRIEKGEWFFWSIIPCWKTDEKSGKRILHGGRIIEA